MFSSLPADIKAPKSVHQRCDQSLLDVVADDDLHHGVPGQTLKFGDTAGLSREERIMEDHPPLDRSKGPQKSKYLCPVLLPGDLYINCLTAHLLEYLAKSSTYLPEAHTKSRSTLGHLARISTIFISSIMTANMRGVFPSWSQIFQK